MLGGEQARRCINQCDRFGFRGEIWPVNPKRRMMESRPCFASVEDLPAAPDAAFIAIPNKQTVKAVEHLASMGAGGAVCYASGFAEVRGDGPKLERKLQEAMGDMPLIGPNCYGMLNYQDGVALWPDEHGGQRCERGAAIVSQSGNITVSLSMQRRGVPITYLISTGNMAGLQTHDYVYAMLDNPNVTAIGLYLEGISNASALSEAALAALSQNLPIVVLVGGGSERGAAVTLSHSNSMSGSKDTNAAYFQKFGMIQTSSLPQLLETLKFVSVLSTRRERTMASISCSGGEAALIADLADQHELILPEFNDVQYKTLHQVLGDKVEISNPLDYHTYIWGNQAAQKACFQAVFSGEQAVTVKVLDIPTEGICDTREWDYAIQAIIDAKKRTQARVAVVSTLHENLPTEIQDRLGSHGIAPMLGLEECIFSISETAKFAQKRSTVDQIAPLRSLPENQDVITTVREYEGKKKLREIGLSVVEGCEVTGSNFQQLAANAKRTANEMGYPVVAKSSTSSLIHKSDVGGVFLNIQSDSELVCALEKLKNLSGSVLIEKMVAQPVLELLIGLRKDPLFGPMMVIGSGGTFAELIEDSVILFAPFDESDFERAFDQIRVGKLLHGYRRSAGDLKAVLESLRILAECFTDFENRMTEIEINPLFVYEKGKGVLAVDVLLRRFD